MSSRYTTPRQVVVTALMVLSGVAASAAPALADDGPTFSLGFRQNAQLLPTLHAHELLARIGHESS